MKEFENDESEILFGNNDPIDNKINEDLKEIKDKLNAEKLSDEFKANLNAKLKEELNKTEDSTKGKIINFPNFTRKLAGICACFVFLFSSCLVFADDIENVILELFGNTDKIIAKAIEDGNYKEIDMDYVEDQGVSIKVDYVVVEDDNIYIAFNVLGKKDCDKIFISDITIEDNNFVLYKTKTFVGNRKLTSHKNYIDQENMVIIYKLTGTKLDLNKIVDLNINVSKITFIKDDISENKNGEWNFEINI